jgi:hypothetical protein
MLNRFRLQKYRNGGQLWVVNVFSYTIHAQTDSSPSCFPHALSIFFPRLTVPFPKLSVILRPLYNCVLQTDCKSECAQYTDSLHNPGMQICVKVLPCLPVEMRDVIASIPTLPFFRGLWNHGLCITQNNLLTCKILCTTSALVIFQKYIMPLIMHTTISKRDFKKWYNATYI